jgi:hypothetical protein
VCRGESTYSAMIRVSKAEIVDNELLSGRPQMKFVLVNSRRPRAESFCAFCCKAIDEDYLRELGQRLCYCDHECYLGHRKLAAMVVTKRARAS